MRRYLCIVMFAYFAFLAPLKAIAQSGDLHEAALDVCKALALRLVATFEQVESFDLAQEYIHTIMREDIQTRDHARRRGIDLGVTIYGVPLALAFSDDQQTRTYARNRLFEHIDHSYVLKTATQTTAAIPDPAIAQQVRDCVADVLVNWGGLVCRITPIDAQRLLLEVRHIKQFDYPDPLVTSAEVTGATIFDTTDMLPGVRANAIPQLEGQRLSLGSRIFNAFRTGAAEVTFSVQLDNGMNCNASSADIPDTVRFAISPHGRSTRPLGEHVFRVNVVKDCGSGLTQRTMLSCLPAGQYITEVKELITLSANTASSNLVVDEIAAHPRTGQQLQCLDSTANLYGRGWDWLGLCRGRGWVDAEIIIERSGADSALASLSETKSYANGVFTVDTMVFDIGLSRGDVVDWVDWEAEIILHEVVQGRVESEAIALFRFEDANVEQNCVESTLRPGTFYAAALRDRDPVALAVWRATNQDFCYLDAGRLEAIVRQDPRICPELLEAQGDDGFPRIEDDDFERQAGRSSSVCAR